MSRLTAAFFAFLAAAAAVAGCGRSDLQLDTYPELAPPTMCQSNADCAGQTASPLCDVPAGRCVACLTSPDTCPDGESCDPATHQCSAKPTGCQSDVDCGATPATPHCRTDVHQCVECTANAQCGASQVCHNFTCVGFCGNGEACAGALSCCSPLCVDEAKDPEHCGACGTVCGPYNHATAGCGGATCKLAACDPGFADCDGVLANGCEIDTALDAANCGACGKACAVGETCSGGVCTGGCGASGPCPGTQTCCGASCKSTAGDPTNCGACGNVCGAVPQASVTCAASACAIGSCAAGYGDCDLVESNGCEAAFASSKANCGGCGNACAPDEVCSGGLCAGTCGGGAACTNGLTCCGATCANTAGDVLNCGGCGNVCPPVANATGACTASACRIGSCNAGFADCDKIVGDGCEVNTNADPSNCGGCGIACAFGASCVAGVCQPGSCQVTGCPAGTTCCGTTCVDTSSDLANCGGCFSKCPPGANLCQSGGCCFPQPGGGEMCSGIVCPNGLSNCSNTCVDETTDPNNCGGCAVVCPANAKCIASVCQVQQTCNGGPACSAGLQCCAAGCADTNTDAKNCGGCGVTCPGGAACVGGTCQGATCNGGPACTGTQTCCANGCSDTGTDAANCGGCGKACPAGDTCVAGACKTSTSCNGGPACAAGLTCCASGCVDTNSDASNCGKCQVVCGSTATCTSGTCAVNEGAFDPTVNPTYLSPGVHSYTSIKIPAGVTVYVAGPGGASGTLDLHSTGDIVIDGVIDLSGGPGTQNTITSSSTNAGRAGSGGYTGEPYQSAAMSAACAFIAGNPGLLGYALAGSAGSCNILSTTTCVQQSDPTSNVFTSPIASYGGGAGVFTGYRGYGSGGGGLAGGAPGALGAAFGGQAECSGVSGGGGAVNGNGGVAGSATYNGKAGVAGQTQCPGQFGFPPAYVGGGGGGSIGGAAASDLAVATTFQPGSGGGGGSCDYLNRPVYGGTSGGGGGGGALRLSTPATLTVNGQLLANGGPGGDAYIGNGSNANCDPQPGAAGGGGSGGVIYLSAPTLTIATGASVSAVGGAGGAQSVFATGGGGGKGGLGRIRVSATQATCSLKGSFNPPLASACSPAATAGKAYVAAYPN